MILNPLGKEHFQKLPLVAALMEVEGIAGQLLGHGARTLLHPPLMPVADRRTEHTEIIDPVVIKEPVVLLSHHRIHHLLRNLFKWDRKAVLDKDLADLHPVAVEDHARRLHLLDLVQVEGIGLGGILRDEPPVAAQTGRCEKKDQDQRRKEPKPQEPRFPAPGLLLLPTVSVACDQRSFPRKWGK